MNDYTDNPNAKQVCNCILEKMEEKYPDEKDAKNADEDETDDVIESCEKGLQSWDNGTDDNGGYIKTVERTDDFKGPGYYFVLISKA